MISPVRLMEVEVVAEVDIHLEVGEEGEVSVCDHHPFQALIRSIHLHPVYLPAQQHLSRDLDIRRASRHFARLSDKEELVGAEEQLRCSSKRENCSKMVKSR